MTTKSHRLRLPLLAQGSLGERNAGEQYTPRYAVWEVTLACDLACKTCGSRAGRARHDELSTDESLDLIDQMDSLGVREVTLIGGEAYLRPDFLQLVRALRARDIFVSMSTGGRGVSAKLASDMKAAGVGFVGVSIDGHRTAHDEQRARKGAYDDALAALANLKQAGIQTTSNCQLNRVSFPTLDLLLDDLIEAKIRSWRFQLTVAMGRAADRPDWLLQPYDLLEVFPKLAELHARATGHGIRVAAGNNVGYFGPYEQLLRGGADGSRYMKSCNAGLTVLGIEADGTIKGCPSLPTSDYTGGNVREHSLRDIWDRGQAMQINRGRTTDDLWGFCKGCYYADVCKAGCTWTSHVLFGRSGNNPYCHHRALELKAIGQRERIALNVKAPGNPFDHGLFELVTETWD